MFFNQRVVFTLTILAFIVAGCGPRGESKTLDEVFVNARNSYQRVAKSDLAKDVGDSLNKISTDLDGLILEASGQSANAKAKDVLDQLNSLVNKSGYTVRPAMTELIHQYQGIVSDPNVTDSAAELKLLATRTYRLLTSELETTKFKVQ